MLMLSGLKDELVLPSHMAHLRDMRQRQQDREGLGDKEEIKGEKEGKGAKLRWTEFPLGGHNDTCTIPDYWKEIGEWLKEEFDLDF